MLPDITARRHEAVAEIVPAMDQVPCRATVLLVVTKFLRLTIQIAVLDTGAYLVLRQEITSGTSIAGSIIMGRALAPVEQLIGGWKQLMQARQSFRRLRAFLALAQSF